MTPGLHGLGQGTDPGEETRPASANLKPMTMHEASRTLVKSSPELWAECSDGESLSRHLGAFGEIRITKLEPETAVAWEGEDVRGTVTLEPSGWGTRVVLTATVEASEAEVEAESAAADAPETPPEPEPAAAITVAEPQVATDPESVAVAEPEPAADPEPLAGAPAQVAFEPEPLAEAEPESTPESEPTPESESTAESEPTPEPEPKHPGFFARLFGRKRGPRPGVTPLGDEDPLIALAGGGEAPKPDATAVADPASPAEPEAEPELTAVPEPVGSPIVTDARPAPGPADEAAPAPADEAAPPSGPDGDPKPTAVLVGALDSLGTPHKRPFSRG
jgi:hypothetical protein